MDKKVWGNSIWYLFHTLAEKINATKFQEQKNNLFAVVKIICSNLPCPDCSEHASKELQRVNINNINDKETFKLFLLEFHNRVNTRLKKQQFTLDELNNKYKLAKLNGILHNFNIVYNAPIPNEKMMAHSFHRNSQNNQLNKHLNEILINCE